MKAWVLMYLITIKNMRIPFSGIFRTSLKFSFISLCWEASQAIFLPRGLSSFFPCVAQRWDLKTDFSWFYSAFPEIDMQNRREIGCQSNARGNLIYKADL